MTFGDQSLKLSTAVCGWVLTACSVLIYWCVFLVVRRLIASNICPALMITRLLGPSSYSENKKKMNKKKKTGQTSHGGPGVSTLKSAVRLLVAKRSDDSGIRFANAPLPLVIVFSSSSSFLFTPPPHHIPCTYLWKRNTRPCCMRSAGVEPTVNANSHRTLLPAPGGCVPPSGMHELAPATRRTG